MNTLYHLEKKDIDKASSIMNKAFKKDPLFEYLTYNNPAKQYYIFKATLKYMFHYGEIIMNEERTGVISYIDYKDYKCNLLKGHQDWLFKGYIRGRFEDIEPVD